MSPTEFYTAEAIAAHESMDAAGVPRTTQEGATLSLSQRVEAAMKALAAMTLHALGQRRIS